jgi:nicotinamide mononucleotide transporter
MPWVLDIKNIFFSFLGYDMSHLEFWATFTGGVAVWLSAKENVWSWILGLFNVILAFLMFFQIQLYPDMFLQVFFFITNLLGFWWWKFPKEGEKNLKNELKISKLTFKMSAILVFIALSFTLGFGLLSKNLHELLPKLFSLPSAFPFLDSFTTGLSIIATFLLMKKKVEAWWLWLFVDIISTYMYFIKDVKIYSLLYLVFCIIALYAAINWSRKYEL